MTAAPLIALEGVSRRFGAVTAVDSVDLAVAEGEFFALLGPSGCGKTTLLRMIAGLEIPSAGRILIDGVDVSRTPANRRPVNMVFQSYAVFPHMNAAQNVAYGLIMDRVPARERARRVEEALALVKLEGLGGRRPDQMSGGQRQRVALARALVKRPRVLLLDEPLSALDAKLREQMRIELKELQERVGVTFLFVTHDQDEALAMASRCAVMDRGRLQQVATPTDLYERPASRFVADFIGQVNLFAGTVALITPEGARIDCPELPAPAWVTGPCPVAEGVEVWVALRPERIVLGPADSGNAIADGANAAPAQTRRATFQGSEWIIEAEISGGRLVRVLAGAGGAVPQVGEAVRLSWSPAAAVVLTA